MKKPTVLVLGATGMLGSMVYRHLSSLSSLNTIGTTWQPRPGSLVVFDADSFINSGEGAQLIERADYIINCIGVLHCYCKDSDPIGIERAIRINSLLPYRLSAAAKTKGSKVIQIATDGVFSGRDGNYTEDSVHDAPHVYGKTKSLGEVNADNYLNIRCSIIGPEIENRVSLFEWFMAHKPGSIVPGYTNHLWNGVTTLQFSQLCAKIIGDGCWPDLRSVSLVHHFIPNAPISKFELLTFLNKVYERNLAIEKAESSGGVLNAILKTKFNILSEVFPNSNIELALKDLRTQQV